MATERDFTSMTTQVLHGGQTALSYQGPIHFGMSTSSHPFRTDRRWTQVNAGLGYDKPIHSLAPGAVSVRATSGPNAGLDLEIETPFHRTDQSHLRGIKWSLDEQGGGYEMTGGLVPSGAGDILGQWMLRANIWSSEYSLHSGAQNQALHLNDGDLHGPAADGALAGNLSHEPYYLWQDHPTDRFHAGAIPIDIGSNQAAFVSEYHARADLTHPLDYIANVEQLQSSVDVHINTGVLPFWDSGSIVSATGIGHRDTAQGTRIEPQLGAFNSATSISGDPAPNEWHSQATNPNDGHGLGLGQRIMRTNDGTLHQFVLSRTATQTTDAASTPVWVHHKKPLNGDLFWSSREHKDNDFAGAALPPTWSGYDEVGPDLSSLTSVSELRVHGAAFAADSNGTIHAVIEICDSTNDGHSLWYHRAIRKSHAQSPHPVFDWDWSATTAVKIMGGTNGNRITFGEDFREPSLSIDSNDCLHLAFVAADNMTPYAGHIYYTQKRQGEDFAAFDGTVGSSGQRYQLVSNPSETSNTAAAPSYVTEVDKPKVLLRSDNAPIVIYRGAQAQNTSVTRRVTGVFINICDGLTTSDSLWSFTGELSKPLAGLMPSADATISTNPNDGVRYYDSVIDEKDRIWTVSVMPLDTSGTVNGSGEPNPYLTRVNTIEAKESLASQYDSLSRGLGFSTTLFHAPPITSGDKGLDAGFHSPTISTDGNGAIHVVACARYSRAYSASQGTSGSDALTESNLLRTSTREHAPYPLQAPSVKAGDQSAATSQPNLSTEGGYGPSTTSISTEVDGWPGIQSNMNTYHYEHLIEMWWSGNEYSTPSSGEWVIRNINFRWLSTPSMRYNATTSSFIPLGQNDTISGNEDFTHTAPQLRAQRFHGFDASYLDLSWITNERAWQVTPHKQTRAMYPHVHPIGTAAEPGSDEWDSATHKLGSAGYPNS